MIKGKTKSGFKFEINENVVDDFELIEAIAYADDSSNPSRQLRSISVVCDKLLGDKKQEFLDHLRTDDGRIPLSSVSEGIVEIMGALGGKAKNSTSSQE